LHAGRALALGQRRLQALSLGGRQQRGVVVDAGSRGGREDEGEDQDRSEEQA
jgi:hypothetical protein